MKLFHSHHFFLTTGKKHKGVLRQDERLLALKFCVYFLHDRSSLEPRKTNVGRGHPNTCPPSATCLLQPQRQRGGRAMRQTPQTISRSSPTSPSSPLSGPVASVHLSPPTDRNLGLPWCLVNLISQKELREALVQIGLCFQITVWPHLGATLSRLSAYNALVSLANRPVAVPRGGVLTTVSTGQNLCPGPALWVCGMGP